MKLFGAAASPFVRKTRIVAGECGLTDKIEIVEVAVAPGNPNWEYSENHNPLRQIPTLLTDGGTHIIDSFVISDYLIRLSGNETMLPTKGEARTKVLNTHALCNGITERAVQTRYETFARPEAYRWPAMIDDNFDRIRGGLTTLNNTINETLDGPFDLSEAAFVAMLKYLDLRFDDLQWRENYPALVEPFDAMCALASVEAAYSD